MNNDAFKNMVRKRNEAFSSSLSSNVSGSTKSIARKAAEEEFHKKKKRKHDDYFSSDEDNDNDDDNGKNVSGKWKDCDAMEDKVENKIKNDLINRYRDRAKERRDGTVSNSQQREELDINALADEQATTQKTLATTIAAVDATCQIRNNLPSLEEAKLILRDFVFSKTNIHLFNNHHSHNNDNDIDFNDIEPINLTSGMLEYIKETFPFKDCSLASNNDANKATISNAVGKNLQRFIYEMVIDGHPSEYRKTWKVPRCSVTSGGGDSNTLYNAKFTDLLSEDVMNAVESVFESRNKIRNEMVNKQQENRQIHLMTNNGKESFVEERHAANRRFIYTNKRSDKGSNKNVRGDINNKDDDDDDEDIFAGLDG